MPTLPAGAPGHPAESAPALDMPPVTRGQIIRYRKEHRESQRCFWKRFGVTQSRGSRFEAGAPICAPVSLLLALYFNGSVTDNELKLASSRLSIARRDNELSH